ncbi:MAG: carbamoyl phosphate synthase large subunit [Spirochaetaceae bacterium]|nr:carbamoyl phosphate synthase large subunit [Spirochaetaceae bacterium]|tara:strand:+ start:10950 stop:14318 length:3369 start_codon:yes stop_codon:yes gene_type:complete
MPRRTDIKSILIPGSGPIIIGQACEFDYSGTQACRVLKQEGFRTILFNSNPATIMTDPSLSDATYIEPMTPEMMIQILDKEKPDAILPTVGGQTALNLVMELNRRGEIEKRGIKLIGANVDAIEKAESRSRFKQAMKDIGLSVPESELCDTYQEALDFRKRLGLPLIIRPSFTLGGTGGGIAFDDEQFEDICKGGLDASPTHQILVEQSILGWKEYELEVMRDLVDNVVIICSIENLDPMGVHTGDSITVAPQQTLSDVQYQAMRDASLLIIREIGVETGGSNIQFAVNPANGEIAVIEMNPRVSRSSALASKATGFPIAKIAALLAVGYSLDEISNDITGVTPASFEPTIDYVVTKIPRFTFEKFPGSKDSLGSMMKSVGETMSIGRTFAESFQKAFRSLETGRHGYGSDGNLDELFKVHELRKDGTLQSYLEESLGRANPGRILDVRMAMDLDIKGELDFPVEKIQKLTMIDPWFLWQIRELAEAEADFKPPQTAEDIKGWKEWGYSDRQMAYLLERDRILSIVADESKRLEDRRTEILETLDKAEADFTKKRKDLNVRPVFRRVDTCAGEFEAKTPYLYSAYEDMDESNVEEDSGRKVMILGGGPNRIGQGIEFDYCCCHASYALEDLGITSIMVNSNPETVSTDYDTSDKLYFEPLTFEDVVHICENEKPDGIIVQFGGQTPLKLASKLQKAGLPIIGTSPDSIDRAEDRDQFSQMINKLGLKQPENGFARNFDEALATVEKIGYPCLVRPSFVLGGRAMAIVHDRDGLEQFMREAATINPEHPILIDRFLEGAIEIDVDALSDGEDVYVAGIMQHIEEAGVHSGDSACVLPPQDIKPALIDEIKEATTKLARELEVKGLINVQYAIQDDQLFLIEVNPRASRTVPFVSKSIGVPLANLATRIMCGQKLKEVLPEPPEKTDYVSVKEAVLPFSRFPGADIILGPEMKSTGEVMGISASFEESYIKAMLGAGDRIPTSNQGGVFFSVSDDAKEELVEEARILTELGYRLYGTSGTANFLKSHGIEADTLYKLKEKKSPNALDEVKNGSIKVIINIPQPNADTRDDAFQIRQEAIRNRVLCITTVDGAKAFANGLKKVSQTPFSVHSLQEIHGPQVAEIP